MNDESPTGRKVEKALEWFDAGVNFAAPHSQSHGTILAAEVRRLRAHHDELAAALADATERLKSVMVKNGTDAEFAEIAVSRYRAVIAKARGA